jgi:hypothetical protein
VIGYLSKIPSMLDLKLSLNSIDTINELFLKTAIFKRVFPISMTKFN